MDNYFTHIQQKNASSVEKYKKKFFGLPLEEKLIGGGFLVVLLGTFMPWSRLPGADNVQSITYNGFQGVTYFVGYTMMLLSLGALTYMLAKFFEIKKAEQLSSKVTPFYFFAALQTTFLSILCFTIFNAFYQIKYSASYVEFGIWICLVGGLVSLVGTYFLHAEAKNAEHKKKTLHHLQDVEDEASRILDQYGDDRMYQDLTPHPDQTTLLHEQQYDQQHDHQYPTYHQ